MTLSRILPVSVVAALLGPVGLLAASAAADDVPVLDLDEATHAQCLEVLREGLAAEDFWPSIHAAEALTLGGYGDEVIAALAPKLASETDDQRRCGLARELVRAGQRLQAHVMLQILAGDDPHGHVHAAESLYKVQEIGDGRAMRRRFERSEDLRLRVMAAGALGQCGNPEQQSHANLRREND